MNTHCQRCEDNFCCVYLGQRTCRAHCRRQNCFCVHCQLYNFEDKSPARYSQKCSFLSECYAYKYLGKFNRQPSYTIQRFCIDHCQLENCPHRDEVTVELNRLTPPPDYRHLINNGGPQEEVDLERRSFVSQQIEDREASVPSGQEHSDMAIRIPTPDRASENAARRNQENQVPS
jgi:hypothetical protein